MTASVAELCQSRQMTVQELTVKTGISPDRVLAIVLGRWTPSPEDRKRIADVFEVSVNDIAWGHKTPIQHIYGHGPG